MVISVMTGALCGIECSPVMVEVDVSNGLPMMEMVGSLSKEVKEAQMRVRVALKNADIQIPPQRITVNLAPASLHKEGSQYDLPIAAAMLAALGLINPGRLDRLFIAGELGLDGEVKAVRGCLPMVLKARDMGLRECILPKANAAEGTVVRDMNIVGVGSLEDMLEFLKLDEAYRKYRYAKPAEQAGDEGMVSVPDFGELYGQEGVKRAMEIAAAGFHNLLMIGPPGAGKTMAARRLPGILPPITEEEALEVSKIYSVAGKLKGGGLIRNRPFVAPHHSATLQALAGGGQNPRPGLISHAHKGVLFLDEVVHFTSAALEVLRQPLEDKKVLIARSSASYEFPAEFMLVAAMNPCPCGNYPDLQRCRCSEEQVRRYLNKLSGPLLDRIDLCVEMGRISLDEYRQSNNGAGNTINSDMMREHVLAARKVQEERFANERICFNAQMGVAELERYVALEGEEREYMDRVYENLHLSLRSYHRVLKVARTIADIDGEAQVKLPQLKEALCYRGVEDRYWR
ncbi:MAG: YifB family Mg chelatase-like AAA ATPase [Lachnospiraceae bacterium]|nr:YifB family Mg chelatase-like AAA ATPase [Lachnospiraceae bacterium]